ncbi:MAG: FAD/NAD(P)-binding oxidoreductase [Planctomycetota bacterium]
MKEQVQVLIVGGGSAGISVAARLAKAGRGLDVAVLDPAAKHYYQPLWTLVGGGDARKEDTERDEKDLIPAGVRWIQEGAVEIDGANREVTTDAGRTIGFEWLVVAAGIQVDWKGIPGLAENLGREGICSNYSYDSVDYTWECIRSFKSGNAVFTHPATPIKCGGAPQKIMYLAAETFEKNGVAKDANIIFGIASPAIFAVEKYAKTLLEVVERHHIDVRYKHDLRELRPASREAVFRDLGADREVVVNYDMIHVTPPMSAPDFLKRSDLGNAGGWVDVDKHTLRHVANERVFALGDCSSLPTSKTGAAIRKQAPVCAENLLAAIEGRPLTGRYDGYTSCPLVTGYGKLVLAEFDYDLKPQETFPFDQSKERKTMYLLKKHLLPKLYWGGMLKGRA